MDLDLVIQQSKKSNMELYLWKNLGSVSEKVIALNIQKDRYISFVSHYFINLLHFEVHVYLLILFIDIFGKVILFALLRNHFFLWFLGKHVRNLWTNTCFCDNFISGHVALAACEWLNQTVFSHNRRFFFRVLPNIAVAYQIDHRYSLIFINSKHFS